MLITSPTLTASSTFTQAQPEVKQFLPTTWDQDIIATLSEVDGWLNKKIPKNLIQSPFDNLGIQIEQFTEKVRECSIANAKNMADKSIEAISKISPKLVEHLDQWKAEGTFSNKMALALSRFFRFILTLPIKAASNILDSLYAILKMIAFTVVHPLKGITNLTKLLIKTIAVLQDPETWIKAGAGTIGGGLGQIAVGNPLVLLGFIIGSSMIAAGMSAGLIMAICKKSGELSKTNRMKQFIMKQTETIPESIATGFFMQLFMGGVQKVVARLDPASELIQLDKALTREQIRKLVRIIARDGDIPAPNLVYHYGPASGMYDMVEMIWRSSDRSTPLSYFGKIQYALESQPYKVWSSLPHVCDRVRELKIRIYTHDLARDFPNLLLYRIPNAITIPSGPACEVINNATKNTEEVLVI